MCPRAPTCPHAPTHVLTRPHASDSSDVHSLLGFVSQSPTSLSSCISPSRHPTPSPSLALSRGGDLHPQGLVLVCRACSGVCRPLRRRWPGCGGHDSQLGLCGCQAPWAGLCRSLTGAHSGVIHLRGTAHCTLRGGEAHAPGGAGHRSWPTRAVTTQQELRGHLPECDCGPQVMCQEPVAGRPGHVYSRCPEYRPLSAQDVSRQ